MYVCICNALTDREVQRVINERQLTSPDEVYAALHCAPRCRSCVAMVAAMLDEMPGRAAAAEGSQNGCLAVG